MLGSAGAVVRHAATLGDRLPLALGLAAPTAEEAYLLEAAEDSGATVHHTPGAGAGADRVLIGRTGRVHIVPAGEPAPEGAALVGEIDWHGKRPTDLGEHLAHLRARCRADREGVKKWLLAEGPERAVGLVRTLRGTLRHVGPILVHVGDRHFTNLGKASNLVGKSVSADSPACRLNALEPLNLLEWPAEDCVFVVLLSILIASGTASRAEEFSGTQLSVERLEEFVRGRIQAYRADVPEDVEALPPVDRLWGLARLCAEARRRALDAGRPVYRVVQGMTINKEERAFDEPVGAADLPDEVRELLRPYLTDAQLPLLERPVELAEAWSPHFPGLHGPAGAPFSTGFEHLLHRIVAVATAATRSHVGMSRGPKDVGLLSTLLAAGDPAPGSWKTSDYYCCVVPAPEFASRFAAEPESLVQVVRAIAARMRWNGWHFMPAVAGPAELFEDRDWFFPPAMPDITEWTSHHHQGHVANGVRHAIRVPLPLVLAGTSRPGIHDFRLMRSDGDPYEPADLRAAMAVARVLQSLYQAHAAALESGSTLTVRDFDNRWYQAVYQHVERGAERGTGQGAPDADPAPAL
ncbi:hypothetical protein ACFXA3_07185 [Streptomyces sp. NPDC059456]|uniref:hypothetical protein n=1 Tax=Streptomyces sp. NPDC059456 TaxID=3346838 RepID=UPI0036CBDA4A